MASSVILYYAQRLQTYSHLDKIPPRLTTPLKITAASETRCLKRKNRQKAFWKKDCLRIWDATGHSRHLCQAISIALLRPTKMTWSKVVLLGSIIASHKTKWSWTWWLTSWNKALSNQVNHMLKPYSLARSTTLRSWISSNKSAFAHQKLSATRASSINRIRLKNQKSELATLVSNNSSSNNCSSNSREAET